MTNKYSLDEIKARIVADGSKNSKIKFLMDECGMVKADAEATYRLIIYASGVDTTTSRRRRAAELAIENLIHFTMGVEMECTNVNRYAVIDACHERGIEAKDEGRYCHNNGNMDYRLKNDGSLRSSRFDRYGTCEIVTPVLDSLDSLKVVCDVINEAGAKVNKSCGLHVHFGARDITPEQVRRVVINYAMCEGAIDTIMPESRRGDNSQWCHSVKRAAQTLANNEHPTIEDCRRANNYNRYHKVNLEALSMHGTIEFRQHSGTTNYEKIEKWVDFLASLLTYSIRVEETIPSPISTIDALPFLKRETKEYYTSRATRFGM